MRSLLVVRRAWAQQLHPPPMPAISGLDGTNASLVTSCCAQGVPLPCPLGASSQVLYDQLKTLRTWWEKLLIINQSSPPKMLF